MILIKCCIQVALNMVTRSLACDLNPTVVTVINIHPGWVKTDMGGDDAPLTTSVSVGHMIEIRNIPSTAV